MNELIFCYNTRVAARVAIQTSKSQSASGFSRLEARVATQTSKSQSASTFSRLQVELEATIEALKVFKGDVAESKDQFLLAFREPEKGDDRGGRGNVSGSSEQDVV